MRFVPGCKPRQGFTFIEVMISLAILSVALVAIIATQSQSAVLIQKARTVAQITELARLKMAELELEFRDKGFGEIREKDSGTFESEQLKGITWSYELRKIDLPSGMPSGTGDQAQQNVGLGAISQALTSSLRQLVLHISWGKAEKGEHFDLMTILANPRDLPQLTFTPQSNEGKK